MTNEVSNIEWTMLPPSRSTEVVVKQVDKTGTYRVSFDSVDLAGSWILAQVEFCRNEMNYKFTQL